MIYKKIIPSEYVLSIKDIDYKNLKKQGVKALFFDLDNTLIPYDISIIPDDIKEFLEELNKEFKVLIISNSRIKRVSYATQNIKDIPFVKFARKPLKVGFKKGLKLLNVKKEDTCIIGDQLMTDIFGANRLKVKHSILVKPVKQKSDHLSTRINRKLEMIFIKKVKNKLPDKYERVLKAYVEK